MSWTSKAKEEDSTALIQRVARPIPPQHQPESGFLQAFVETVRSVWNFLRNYSAEDITRLKEAGVRQVEGKAATAHADAAKTLAEAAEAHARAERCRAEAQEAQARANKTNAEAVATILKAKSEFAKEIKETEIVAAEQSVVDAISRIRQLGGTVAFDSEQLQKLLQDSPEIERRSS